MDKFEISPRSRVCRLLVWWIVWHIWIPDGATGLMSCKQTGPCVCEAPDGSKIDLSPLYGHGYPMFSGRGADSNYYQYNPCSGFTDQSSQGACTNVAACQETPYASYYPVGDASSAVFMEDEYGIYILYTSTDTSYTTRTTNVRLSCDPSTEARFSVPGETTPGSLLFEMSLTTKYACISFPPSAASAIALGRSSTALVLWVWIFYLLAV